MSKNIQTFRLTQTDIAVTWQLRRPLFFPHKIGVKYILRLSVKRFRLLNVKGKVNYRWKLSKYLVRLTSNFGSYISPAYYKLRVLYTVSTISSFNKDSFSHMFNAANCLYTM